MLDSLSPEQTAAEPAAFWPDADKLRWVEQPRILAPGLDSLLTWAFSAEASRIALSTGHPIWVRTHGQIHRVTTRPMDELDFSQVVNHRGPTSTMNQTEIPRDLPTFAALVRSAMRREPIDIIVGECRDSETMSATVETAISGHPLTTTVHANNVPLTMQRVASLCPSDERANLISAVAQSLRLIVNQRLTRTINGRRTALREVLVFDAPLRNQLLGTDPTSWPSLTQRAVEEDGISYRNSIESAVRKGRISEQQTAAYELRQVG